MAEYILSRPFIALFCTTALGIICFAILQDTAKGILILFFLASLLSLIILWRNKIHSICFWVFAFLFSLGLQYLHENVYHVDSFSDKISQLKKGTFIILESELIRNQLQVNAQLLGHARNCKFKLHFPNSTYPVKLYFGDTLQCNFSINTVKPILSRSFSRYNNFLLNRHIYYNARITYTGALIKPYTGFSIFNKAQKLSQHAKNILHQTVPDALVAQLLVTLVIGDKTGLDKNLKADFISTGTAHILAVSGLHLGMIYSLLLAILSPLTSRYGHARNARLLQSTLILISIWTFTIISGLSTSAVRASVMLSFLETGKLLKRPIDAINSLFSCGFFMLIHNPCTLWDIGFQLSLTAVLGIILLKPYTNLLYRFTNVALKNLAELITISLCAQVFVAPLLIYHFQQFPIYFLLANIVWIPLSFILLIIAVIILFIYSMMPWAASILSSACILICKPGFLIFDLLRKWPMDGFDMLWIYPEHIILFYACMLLLYFWLKDPKMKYLFLSLCMFILIPLSLIIRFEIIYSRKELIIFVEKHLIQFSVKSGNHLYSTNPESIVLKKYIAENRITQIEYIHRDTLNNILKPQVGINHLPFDIIKDKIFRSEAQPQVLGISYKKGMNGPVEYLILNHHKFLDHLSINNHSDNSYHKHVLNSDGPLILKL